MNTGLSVLISVIFISLTTGIALVAELVDFSKIVFAQEDFNYYYSPLGTTIKYPSDWNPFYINQSTIFLSPSINDSPMDSGRILLEGPISISSISIDALFDHDARLNGYTPTEDPQYFDSADGSRYIMEHYTYNDPYFGNTEAMDVYIINGDSISRIVYGANPNSFEYSLPIFTEMVASYSNTPAPTPFGSVDDECFDMSVLCGLSPDTSLDPEAGAAISGLLAVEGGFYQ